MVGLGAAQGLLQPTRLSGSPGPALHLQPSPPSSRRQLDVTWAPAAFRLPLSRPFLLASCLLGVDNEQQIDRYCTGICLKVHGTHQSMAGAGVPPQSRRCELRCPFAPGSTAALPAPPAAPSVPCQSRPHRRGYRSPLEGNGRRAPFPNAEEGAVPRRGVLVSERARSSPSPPLPFLALATCPHSNPPAALFAGAGEGGICFPAPAEILKRLSLLILSSGTNLKDA